MRGRCSTALSLASICLFFALASFARADLTDQQVKDYVRNTWEITDLSDQVLSETLDTSYSGIPFKSWIKFFIRAPSIANPLFQGDYRKAASEAEKYAADKSIDLILAQAGLTGVSAVAQLAVWPIEHALLNFQQTVAQNSFKKQLDLYFQARKFNSYEAIRDLTPADILEAEGNPVSKDDSG